MEASPVSFAASARYSAVRVRSTCESEAYTRNSLEAAISGPQYEPGDPELWVPGRRRREAVPGVLNKLFNTIRSRGLTRVGPRRQFWVDGAF